MKKYDVAAYVWPSYTGDEPRTRMFWPEGIGEWQTVRDMKPRFEGHEWPRKPLWGYVNEADPFVMEAQISAAVSHGVNVFIYDWYWYDDRPFLEQCLDNGFLRAKNNEEMRFCVMWANHPASTTWDKRTAHLDIRIWQYATGTESFRKIAERVVKNYFTKPNYYRINGKPVFVIYDLCCFIRGMGGIENTRRALDILNEIAVEAGFDGVYTQVTLRGHVHMDFRSRSELGFDGSVRDAVDLLGIDSATHYQMLAGVKKHIEYSDLIPGMAEEWDYCEKNYKAVYYPHVSLGWDPTPRYIPLRDDIVMHAKPEYVKKVLTLAKEYLDSHENLPAPLVTINSWNEWTETSYLEPDDLYGYAYLEAVRDVFLRG